MVLCRTTGVVADVRQTTHWIMTNRYGTGTARAVEHDAPVTAFNMTVNELCPLNDDITYASSASGCHMMVRVEPYVSRSLGIIAKCPLLWRKAAAQPR